jgi:hypothetical protein
VVFYFVAIVVIPGIVVPAPVVSSSGMGIDTI